MPAPTTQTAKKPAATTPQAPAAKPASPPAPAPPAAPPATPKPSFRPLEDDLVEMATQPAAKPGKAASKPAPPEPSAATEPAPETAPGEPATTPPAPAAAAPESGEDYLMGSVAPKETGAEGEIGVHTKPETPAATGPLKAPELRAEYSRVKTRLAEVEKELADFKAKNPGMKPVDEPERKAFTEQITTLKKQLEDTSGALKTAAYEQSDEFRTKFQQPFEDAWRSGVQLVSRLTMTDQEGNTRKGTENDFLVVMREADDEKAAELAQEMFGPNSFYVLAERRDIQKLEYQRVKALEEYRSTLSQREKARAEATKKEQEEREARRIQAVALFQKFNTEAAEKYPDYFGPTPGDDQGNDLLARGYRDADLAFSGAPELTEERRIRLHSAIRNRAAAFGRLVHRLQTKDAEIAELKKQLEEIKGSTPGGGQVGREDQTPKRLTAEEEIEAAAMKYR